MACSCCVLYKASTEKPIDRMLSSLVSDYLNDNCKSVADEFNEKVKPPLLTRKSPNLRDILKFFLQRSEQSVSLVYRLKECEEQDSEEPEKNWAVYHAMCYEPIAPRKSSETNTWAKAQPKNDPTVKKEEIIAQIGRPSPELIRKTTPMLVRKDIAQKSKLSSKKSALIKNMIKKREQISVVKKKVGGKKTSSRMAKKVAPAALQTEVVNDEEWAKILQRKGLVVVDVYSDWSGPCTGMVSILKKLKMEVGGDALSYATASCDRVSDLKRFQGKSEPTWMFIHEGRMINLMFGAHCPEFMKMLTTELERVQNNEEHEFSLDVSEKSPEEVTRLKIQEEVRIAKEKAKKSRKEAETKARYEAEMLHLTTSLCHETCLLLFPWIFKDEEGKRRDKKSSPPYVELVEELLPENYTVEQEIRKRMNEDLLKQMLDESTYSFSEFAKQLLFDGKCMFMRLKIIEEKKDLDVHNHLCDILFNESTLPESEDCLNEECYAGRHCPAFEVPDKENKKFPFVWTPPNPRNKAVVFRTIFNAYTIITYPYEDKMTKVPITVFKYDYTRKNDLKIVLEMFNDDVIDFGIFEYDKPPEAKMIDKNIETFETSTEEKTGYEIFVCTVKKVGCEAFLGFAGIGPFHVSESPEKAIEESKLYFPDVTLVEETQSDDEEKPEESMEEQQDEATTK